MSEVIKVPSTVYFFLLSLSFFFSTNLSKDNYKIDMAVETLCCHDKLKFDTHVIYFITNFYVKHFFFKLIISR